MSKICIYGIIVQLSVFTFVFANEGVAQNKSINEIEVSVDLRNPVKLDALIKSIESSTDFSFSNIKQEINTSSYSVSLEAREYFLGELLSSIASQTNLSFHRVNDYIQIRKREAGIDPVVEELQVAQTITGKVTDENGEPLPGATVLEKGTTNGTITNVDGGFQLSISENATLLVSFVGYLSQEVNVGGRNEIAIQMAEDSEQLDEVVVVGYGTQKRENLTGAVSTLRSEELEKRPVANVAQMLQGKLSGVEVIQNTGQPGAEGVNIRIRGLNSFGTSNSPIIFVDGIEGVLSNIDPSNIESISVLKDASSAAIYGSRAANGVILVTTKRGRAGQSNFSYSGNFAIHEASRYPELVNDPVEYMKMFNVASDNSGVGITYPQNIIDSYANGQNSGFNWDDVFFKKAFVQNHNIAASGGTEQLRYNLGLNLWDQPGILNGFEFKKYRVLLNIDSKVNQYISLGAGVNFSQGNKRETFDGQSNQMITWAANPPTYGPKLPDGRYTWSAYPFEIHNASPVAFYENGGAWTNDYNVLSNMFIEVRPFKGLTWKTNGGVKFNNSSYKKQIPSIKTYDFYTGEPRNVLNSDVQLTASESKDILYTLFSTFNYERSIGDHSTNVLIGTSLESFEYDYLSGFRRGFPSNDLAELNAGALPAQTTNGTGNEWALGSYFARVNYNYKGKYLFEANARIDGSSRFPSSDRYGFFPSFSAGWVLSEENFAKNAGWLDFLKIRASWGQLGNQQIGNYPYQDLLSLGYGYAFGNELSQGVVQTRLTNRLLKWETTTISDVGIDFESRNGLFSLTFDYFSKETSDILRPGQVLASTGLAGPTINDGVMTNTGFEFNAGHRNSIGDLNFSVNVNFSHYKNKLVKFGADEISGRTIKQQGIPYDSYYLNEWDGIFQNQQEIDNSPVHYYAVRPGTIKIKDANGDGNANLDDRVVVDGKYPKYYYGITLGLEWKGIDLSAFFQGVQGVKYYVNGWSLEPFVQGSRPPVKWRDAWTAENPSNELPLLYFADREVSNRQNSTFWLMDGSYFKLKNLQIGYTIPEKVFGKLPIQKLRIYLSGDNLFVITKFEGFDPERNPAQSRFGEYPQVRIYSAGVKVQF